MAKTTQKLNEIKRALTKAGFTASKRDGKNGNGCWIYTDGFTVQATFEGDIRVGHMGRGDIASILAKYEDALKGVFNVLRRINSGHLAGVWIGK